MNKKLLIVISVLVIGAGAGYAVWRSPISASVAKRVEPLKSESAKVGVPSSTATGVAAAPSAIQGSSAPAATNTGAAYDPRLANLVVTTDNPTIEYVRGEGGLVIAELDNDPNNISYKKPLKEYQYHQGKVQTMTRYEYFKTEIIVTTIDVAYKPDGSVYDYREQTSTRKIGQ